MGMFDYIKCEVPLPDGWEPGESELQTKDLGDGFCDGAMVTHIITKEGRLLLDAGYSEAVPKEERPYPDEEGFLGLAGSLRHIPIYKDSNYHGYVRFYGYEGDANDEQPIDERWHEYKAKFTDGQLVEIIVLRTPEE